MGQDEKVRDIDEKRDPRLPLELAELLTPPLEHALNHPLRREIVRALNRSDRPRSAAELGETGLRNASVTLLNYHAAVLEGCDLVRVEDNGGTGEGVGRRYSSNVTEDVQVIAILGATEAFDRHDN